jgi:hypothetical protein
MYRSALSVRNDDRLATLRFEQGYEKYANARYGGVAAENRARSECVTGRRHVRDFVISVAGVRSSTEGMIGSALPGRHRDAYLLSATVGSSCRMMLSNEL